MPNSKRFFGLFQREQSADSVVAGPDPEPPMPDAIRQPAAHAPASETRTVGKHIAAFQINGNRREAIIEPHMLLLDVIREKLALTGTKRACASGNCGACTVLLDGEPVCSCLTLAVMADGREIRTVEGLRGNDGQLHPLQTAFINNCAAQCGYCTSGMLMTSVALLAANPKPTREDVKHAISGNICRCTGYVKIVDAIVEAAESMTAAEEVRG